MNRDNSSEVTEQERPHTHLLLNGLSSYRHTQERCGHWVERGSHSRLCSETLLRTGTGIRLGGASKEDKRA